MMKEPRRELHIINEPTFSEYTNRWGADCSCGWKASHEWHWVVLGMIMFHLVEHGIETMPMSDDPGLSTRRAVAALGEQRDRIRSTLRGAKDTLEDESSGRTLQERLRDAWNHELIHLDAPGWVPDVDAQKEFEAILAAFPWYGDPMETQGRVPATTWSMDDPEAEELKARILKLADRYHA